MNDMKRAPQYLVIAIALTGSAAQAQINDANFQGVTREGFHLYEVSAFSSYVSSAYPFSTTTNLIPGAAQLGYDISYGASAGVGWQYSRGDRGSVTVMYTGTYNRSENFSSLSAFGHSLRANANWNLTPKWSVSLSGSGQYSTLAQYLFEPSGLSTVAQTPSSNTDLAAALGVGQFSSSQAGSQFAGSSAAGALTATATPTPATALLLGTRVLSYATQASLSYQASERLSLYVSGMTAAGQNRVGNSTTQVQQSYITPRSIGVNGGVTLDYELTPRTNIGFGVTEARISNAYQEAYTSQAEFSLGRKMGTNWFIHGAGGGSYSIVKQQQVGVPLAKQFIGSASLGYRLATQTVLVSYNRSSSETNGFAVGTNSRLSGAWIWRRPGARWSLTADLAQQQINNTGFVTLSGWQVSGGATVHLVGNIVMSSQYVYANDTGNYLGNTTKVTVNSVRLTFGWVPQWNTGALATGANLAH
jgi:hypothetical protein